METRKNVVSDSLLFLTGEQLAELLGVSRAKAYRLMQRGEVPVIRLGKSVRVPREALLEFLRSRTQQPAGAAA